MLLRQGCGEGVDVNTVNKSDPVHGVCGACGSGITVDNGLTVGRDDADLLAALEEAHGILQYNLGDTDPHVRSTCDLMWVAIAKAKKEA